MQWSICSFFFNLSRHTCLLNNNKRSNRVNWHFNLKKFRASEVNRVKISLACVFAFMAVGWPLIIYKVGILGWVKFWLMPWLGYHFWVNASLFCVSLFLFSDIASEDKMVTHYCFPIDEHVHNGSSYGSAHSFQGCG